MSKSFYGEKNLTMLTDFYELTMANGYFANEFKDRICYFDMFFRKVPDDGGFAIMAGVEQLVEYLSELLPDGSLLLRHFGRLDHRVAVGGVCSFSHFHQTERWLPALTSAGTSGAFFR